MITEVEGGVIESEIRIAARPETIFPFLTDPTKLAQWQGQSAVLDARPGGIYSCTMTKRDVARGTFLVVEPPHRVIFTFGWEGEGHPIPPGSSTVEITLTEDGSSTIVRLRHSGLPADARSSHAEGWSHYLPRLLEASEGREPGPDSWSEE